jgi:hypothetical protein
MGIEKSDSFVRHLLEVWRLDLALRIGRGNVPDPEVIRENEHHVGDLVVISVEKTARGEQREEKPGNHVWLGRGLREKRILAD